MTDRNRKGTSAFRGPSSLDTVLRHGHRSSPIFLQRNLRHINRCGKRSRSSSGANQKQLPNLYSQPSFVHNNLPSAIILNSFVQHDKDAANTMKGRLEIVWVDGSPHQSSVYLADFDPTILHESPRSSTSSSSTSSTSSTSTSSSSSSPTTTPSVKDTTNPMYFTLPCYLKNQPRPRHGLGFQIKLNNMQSRVLFFDDYVTENDSDEIEISLFSSSPSVTESAFPTVTCHCQILQKSDNNRVPNPNPKLRDQLFVIGGKPIGFKLAFWQSRTQARIDERAKIKQLIESNGGFLFYFFANPATTGLLPHKGIEIVLDGDIVHFKEAKSNGVGYNAALIYDCVKDGKFVLDPRHKIVCDRVTNDRDNSNNNSNDDDDDDDAHLEGVTAQTPLNPKAHIVGPKFTVTRVNGTRVRVLRAFSSVGSLAEERLGLAERQKQKRAEEEEAKHAKQQQNIAKEKQQREQEQREREQQEDGFVLVVVTDQMLEEERDNTIAKQGKYADVDVGSKREDEEDDLTEKPKVEERNKDKEKAETPPTKKAKNDTFSDDKEALRDAVNFIQSKTNESIANIYNAIYQCSGNVRTALHALQDGNGAKTGPTWKLFAADHDKLLDGTNVASLPALQTLYGKEIVETRRAFLHS